MEGNSVLRMVFSLYFLNFNDKTENFCLKSSENHYFLAEINFRTDFSSTNFPKFIVGFSFDVESSC